MTDLAQARRDTDTEPTKAQQEAGNYKKGRVTWNGFTIAIENPKGSTRSGTNKAGKTWSTVMKHDYGYFEGIIGRDKDHLDVFIGPQLSSELVHVVNQVDSATGRFDEHKVVIGAIGKDEAELIYLDNYEKGWGGLGSVKAMTLDDFRRWTSEGDLTKRAAAALNADSGSMADFLAEYAEQARAADTRKEAPEGTPSAKFRKVVHIERVPICPHCDEEILEKHDAWDQEYKDCWRHRGPCYDKGPFILRYPEDDAPGDWSVDDTESGVRFTRRGSGKQSMDDWYATKGDLSLLKTNADGDICTVCKEPWSTCLGRHGSKPCACGSGKPRNECDCPGGTPDESEKDAEVDCPLSAVAQLDALGLEPEPLEKMGICRVVNLLREGRPVLLHLDDGDKVAVAFDDDYLYFVGDNADEHMLFDTVRSRWSSKEAIALQPGDERLLKQAAGRDTDLDFKNYGDLSRLKAQQIVDFVIQHHLAQRSGPHYDVRFGTPQTGLYSWATKHELPAVGEKRMLFQQPVHPHAYGDFVGYLRGYGQGEVRRHHKGKITMLQAGPDKVEFVTNEETPRRFVMVKPTNATKRTHWLLLQRPYQKDVPHDDVAADMSQAGAQVPGQPGGVVVSDRVDSGSDRALVDPGVGQGLTAAGGSSDQPDLAQFDAGARTAPATANPGAQDLADQPSTAAIPSTADGPDPERSVDVDGSTNTHLRSLKSSAANTSIDADSTDLKRPPIVAVDVDGTIAQDYEEFDPDHIPPPRPNARKWLDKFREAGAIIVLHTVRGKDSVLRAWAKEHKLPFDFINESPHQPPGSSDKLFADVYWDNLAVSAEGPLNASGPDVLERLSKVAEDVIVCADPEQVYELLRVAAG